MVLSRLPTRCDWIKPPYLLSLMASAFPSATKVFLCSPTLPGPHSHGSYSVSRPSWVLIRCKICWKTAIHLVVWIPGILTSLSKRALIHYHLLSGCTTLPFYGLKHWSWGTTYL